MAFFMSIGTVYAQSTTVTQTNGSGSNSIQTAVPFLRITPDARSGSMGDVGVAISGDANSLSNNPSKIAFLEEPGGFAVSYSPWLKQIIPDVNLAYLSGFYHLSNRNTIGASLRYFSLGQIQLTDQNQQDLGTYNPNEFALDFTFARNFGYNLSLASSVRYIYSDLFSGQFVAGQDTRPGTAVAMDLSAFYKSNAVVFNTNSIFSAGINVSNIGTKLSYVDGGNEEFLPTNLKLGIANTFLLDDENSFTFSFDLNKLLVPTQPEYDINGKILRGRDPNRSITSGIFGSFSDAPGGLSEELSEISFATGMEYWYNQQFALRAGYFYEHPDKGNRRYLTLGAGLKYNVFNIDMSYLVGDAKKSPLAGILRFGLLFNFGVN
ncbi:type IX secretion system outer membrane channel protein PorV [Pedobacter flavus]|uniref:Type IX secretion system outer membrane channel protein PorV n=1 Tax=Pedobacter flavus TaxID=3113906 RepID=A0ABU7H0E4_9SPHI|nr:type IX secretion system outer membrane channel protein PorV [Pedobacter sp. VNH31]MEE1884650.1 type IX secretion system outer membrane channel protein PorV [Pedobacter sp. VNH31]